MKQDNCWPFQAKVDGLPQVVHITECKHPEIAQAVAMLNEMSEKARKQALAHIGVIFRFDKGTF